MFLRKLHEHQPQPEKTMKKYLTLAAVLGTIAFVSVSYLAHAEPEAGAVTTAVEKAADAPAAAPVMDAAAKDKADCDAAAAMKKADGTEPTMEEKDAASKKCMEDKAAAAAAPAATDAMKPADAPKAEGK
jgi:hypothetical protein